jgi:hypothetical protein
MQCTGSSSIPEKQCGGGAAIRWPRRRGHTFPRARDNGDRRPRITYISTGKFLRATPFLSKNWIELPLIWATTDQTSVDAKLDYVVWCNVVWVGVHVWFGMLNCWSQNGPGKINWPCRRISYQQNGPPRFFCFSHYNDLVSLVPRFRWCGIYAGRKYVSCETSYVCRCYTEM